MRLTFLWSLAIVLSQHACNVFYNQTFVNRKLEKSTTIKQARLKMGLPQAEFARKVHIGRSYLSRLENGHEKIQQWVVDRVEKIYNEWKAQESELREENGARNLPYDELVYRRIQENVSCLSKHRPIDEQIALLRDIARDGENLANWLAGVSSMAISEAERGAAVAEDLARKELRGARPLPKADEPIAYKPSPPPGTSQHHKSQQLHSKEPPDEQKGQKAK
jgi:transcriptional regulator with XRE-family HTH domain